MKFVGQLFQALIRGDQKRRALKPSWQELSRYMFDKIVRILQACLCDFLLTLSSRCRRSLFSSSCSKVSRKLARCCFQSAFAVDSFIAVVMELWM